ncbi:hypothetical protein JB92DRAFT_3144942 [Gautieria morchelliformis]|nr:hypothetical protein JB92DRAFT_3144942 [Gautieria morchelliformis]
MAAPPPIAVSPDDQPAEPINVAADPGPATTQMPAIDPGAMAAGTISAEKTAGESMDSVASVVPLAVDPGPATTHMPAIDPGAIDSPATPTSSSGETMVLDEETNQPKGRRLACSNAVIFGSPSRKRSFEEESETAPANVNGKGKAVAHESDDINEPTRKR